MTTLVIIRGAPGTGKSTIARMITDRLRYEHYEADMFHTRRGVFDFQSWRAVAAHHWCQVSAEDAIERRKGVVIGNPLLTQWDVDDYVNMADDVIIVSLEHRYGSIHAPMYIEQRMRNEFVHHRHFERPLPAHARAMTEQELIAWVEAQEKDRSYAR